MNWEEILGQCSGVESTYTDHKRWNGQVDRTYYFKQTGDIVVPDNLFFEVTATATEGTIGKLVGLEIEFSKWSKRDDGYARPDTCTFLIQVEGRPRPNRINASYTKRLLGYSGPTKYVRNVSKHKKAEVKNPVNKFKQELQQGDWVVGVTPGKSLQIGRVTRWTSYNIWAVPGDDLTDKEKEFRLDSIRETFLMPNDDHVASLTFAALQGWNGK